MPAAPLRVALAQIDTTVGDIAGNLAKCQENIARAKHQKAELVVFPELTITGYPPEDLLLREGFLADARTAIERLARETEGIVALVGFPERAEDVYNACAVLADGELRGVFRKTYLPNYGVFDEERYFQSGQRGAIVELDSVSIGLTICEDIWEPGPPLSDEALGGATVIVNLSASPFHAGKGIERERMVVQRARDSLSAVVFCNLVGGQDELVFDGHSLVADHDGTVIARAHQFREELLVATIDPEGSRAGRLRDTRHRPAARRAKADVDVLARLPRHPASDPQNSTPRGGPVAELLDPLSEVAEALRLGLHDYVEKNGFRKVVLGLSGGIDSALVACLAADALGSERVVAVVMPSPHSSDETQDDARRLAENLGVELVELPIGTTMDSYATALAQTFDGRESDLTEENLQARIRGNLLMALSNKFGWLVLTTGNKSELSVGYSTLYGDTAGGFAIIKDVPKTLVYELVRHRNALGDEPVVPPSILERAPSAELRPDQRDDDSLPPYEVLDPILEAYVEEDMGREQIAREGFSPQDIAHVTKLVDLAEYKRRQNPPGIKITTKSFGRDRRMPITNHYNA